MTEEYIDERERDLLDYLRNNTIDPENRGETTTQSFIATASQTEFYLSQPAVKNVADTITRTSGSNTFTLRKGYEYYVVYGEGKELSKVILYTGLSAADVLNITYHFGQCLLEREYSRSDVKLPRIIMMFLTGSENFAALGDYMDVEGVGTKGSYFNASYRFEIRDQYATRARKITSRIFNQCKKLRHANIFRVNITRPTDLQNFDYDPEKNCYIWQFTLEIEWEIMFQ